MRVLPSLPPFLRSWPSLLAALALPCAAQPPAAPVRADSLPIRVTLGVERVHLPAGETLGLVGGSLLFDAGDDWSFGPAVYGAATGRRGGLFVGGVELQRYWPLGRGMGLATGIFAGGGGGAAAPVGSGLMLRPALTLLTDVGPRLQAGLSWSQLGFPSGDIRSRQLGLVLAWRDGFRHYVGGRGGEPLAPSAPSGLGFDRMLATAGVYRLDDGSSRRIGLAGARAERLNGRQGSSWGLEAAGAVSGDAAGYMEILATTAVSRAPLPEALPGWRVGARLGAGLGGGGGLPTGGGLIGRVSVNTEWSPRPGWALGAELGAVRAVDGPLRARHAQLWLGIELEPKAGESGDAAGQFVRTEWSASIQHLARVQREDGSRRALGTIGLKLSRYLGEHLYLSGQAHSAFAGGAGACSIGLFGAGVAMTPAPNRRVGAELLVGAAGGGGVRINGGALVQGLLWAGWAPRDGSEWRAGIGTVRALRGGLDSALVELSWTRAFGASGR